jgi:hypothetical protein
MTAQLLNVIADGGGGDRKEVLLAKTLEALIHVVDGGLARARLVPELHYRTHVRILANPYSKARRKRP